MLQLHVKEFDIVRISKLLVKYQIKSSISNQVIILEGDLSDELLNQLCDDITICSVQNFCSEVSIDKSPEETNEINHTIQDTTHSTIIPQTIHDYDLLYPSVRRGEVYWCDFGEPFGCEQGYIRPVIVVQNDKGNTYSDTTIVLPCTTKPKNGLSVHYSFHFSTKNMIDYKKTLPTDESLVMAEQITVIDKKRLRKFIGTMNDEFMKKIQDIIDISLNLTRTEKIEKVYIDNPVCKKDLNIVQIKLLSLVDINELLNISKYTNSDEIKAQKILKLFGFDIQKNGVQYLLKAILISSKDEYFNLDTLCQKISQNETNIEKEEIKRLIVARVKECLKFKKSPTIDFIRLVNCFLIKEDKGNEKNNI